MSINQSVGYLQSSNEKVLDHPTEAPTNTLDCCLQRATQARCFQPVRGICTAGGPAQVPGMQGAPLRHHPAADRRCGSSSHPGFDRQLETFLSGNWWYAHLRECPWEQNKKGTMMIITKPFPCWVSSEEQKFWIRMMVLLSLAFSRLFLKKHVCLPWGHERDFLYFCLEVGLFYHSGLGLCLKFHVWSEVEGQSSSYSHGFPIDSTIYEQGTPIPIQSQWASVIS